MTISSELLEFLEDEEKRTETHSAMGPKLNQDVELGLLDLFKHPGCRNATLIMFIVWTSVTLGENNNIIFFQTLRV